MRFFIEPIEHETFRNPKLYEIMTTLQTATENLIKGGGDPAYLTSRSILGENLIKKLDMDPIETQRIDVPSSLVVYDNFGYDMAIIPDEDLEQYIINNPLSIILRMISTPINENVVDVDEFEFAIHIYVLFMENLVSIAYDTGFEGYIGEYGEIELAN